MAYRYACRRLKRMLCQVCLATALSSMSLAHGAISLSHTRLIVSTEQPEVTPRVVNEGTQPVLLQLWFDTGAREADPQTIVVPFLVLPPILRLEPGAMQRLRILYTGQASPPADRESVYWLNILEIPPKAGQANPDLLQISFRTRVKVFFRPAGLNVDPNVHEALRFEFVRQGSQDVLRITNPTPVHQTLLDVAIGNGRDDPSVRRLPPPEMLAPGASADVPLGLAGQGTARGARVLYSVLDDYGAVVEGSRDIAGR